MRARWVCAGAVASLMLVGWVRQPVREDFVLAEEIIEANNWKLASEGIKCVGSGGTFPGTIRTISLDFRTKWHKFDSIDEARAFFCKFFEEYARPFNEEKRIRPYLYRFPVNANMLELAVFFCDPENEAYGPPSVARVGCALGKIRYSQRDPHTGKYFDIYEEPFDAAQRIVAGKEISGAPKDLSNLRKNA